MREQKPRPTDEEFEELRRKRDEALSKHIEEMCKEEGWDIKAVHVHSRDRESACYCGCPDGPCQHIWDGPEHVSEDQLMSSATCSRCGEIAFYHHMRVLP